MAPNVMIEPLGTLHNRAAFTCGVPALDRYLQQQAQQDIRKRIASVRVLRVGDSVDVVGYYAISATSIDATNVPQAFVKRLTRHPVLPAFLLGRLAVDQRYAGQGYWQLLLMSALQHCLDLTAHVGAVAVVVDAKNAQARHFYEKYGFQQFLDDPDRLFIPMMTIVQLANE